MAADPRQSPLPWMVGVIAAVAVIWLLRAATVVAMPLAAAFFIAIIVYPVQKWLHARLRRYQWAALPLTMLLIVGILGGLIWALAEAVDEAVERAPAYSAAAQQSWDQLLQSARQYNLPLPEDLTASENAQQRLQQFGTAAVTIAWEVVSGLVLVLFLVLLMLLEAPVWRENAYRMFRGHGETAGLAATVRGISEKVRTYLYVRTVLGAMSAVAAGLWLLIMGVDLVLVWVLLTFALNYIPNLGSVIAVIPPSLMALVQHGPLPAAMTLGGLTVIEQIIGNYIDPRMQGRRLQISPVLVLVALVFWTWVWGPVGALLAVPMTVTLLAAASHAPALQPLATLLAADGDGDGEQSGAEERI